jgi:hypothetical protein
MKVIIDYVNEQVNYCVKIVVRGTPATRGAAPNPPPGEARDLPPEHQLEGADAVIQARMALDQGRFDELYRLLALPTVLTLVLAYDGDALKLLTKAGREVRDPAAHVISDLYRALLDHMEVTGQYDFVPGYIDYALFEVRRGEFDKGFVALHRAKATYLVLDQRPYASCCICAQVVLHLRRGDLVGAQKFLNLEKERSYFSAHRAASLIGDFVEAVSNQDVDRVQAIGAEWKRTCSNPSLAGLPDEIPVGHEWYL